MRLSLRTSPPNRPLRPRLSKIARSSFLPPLSLCSCAKAAVQALWAFYYHKGFYCRHKGFVQWTGIPTDLVVWEFQEVPESQPQVPISPYPSEPVLIPIPMFLVVGQAKRYAGSLAITHLHLKHTHGQMILNVTHQRKQCLEILEDMATFLLRKNPLLFSGPSLRKS